MIVVSVLDAAGRRRSPATLPGYHAGGLPALPVFPAFIGFSEAGVFRNAKLTRTPVGWKISGYGGVGDGWDELKGYWRPPGGSAHDGLAQRRLLGGRPRQRRLHPAPIDSPGVTGR